MYFVRPNDVPHTGKELLLEQQYFSRKLYRTWGKKSVIFYLFILKKKLFIEDIRSL